MSKQLIVVGGGLAGTEAAWQAAEHGLHVRLYEMRPHKTTPAHVTDRLAELVCSNSLGSNLTHKAPGLLKAELRGLGSMVLECAEQTAVPAGSSLAVDREQFSELVTQRIANHPNIEWVPEEVTAVPDQPAIIASGPLTADALARDIGALSGQNHLYFYDALSPIVNHETIDLTIAFRQSRYDEGEQLDGDYINCPMTRAEYDAFTQALLAAETITLKEFEQEDAKFFEGCMPIEAMARRGEKALAFGPMRPVGLIDPRTGKRPYAVVQLRQDNLVGSLYNIVGFQTNLRWGEQKRVLRLIPGLENAEFVRYGQLHRNFYLDTPRCCEPDFSLKGRADILVAGQMTGVEGYVESIASGLLTAWHAAARLRGLALPALPRETILGSLLGGFLFDQTTARLTPMNANFGLLPDLPELVRDKRLRKLARGDLAARELAGWLAHEPVRALLAG